MKVNPIYRALLDKSISCMLSAIELYNKPDFKYREDAFAILSVNAWELLLKSQLFKCNKYTFKAICKTEPLKTKAGTNHKRKTNRIRKWAKCLARTYAKLVQNAWLYQ